MIGKRSSFHLLHLVLNAKAEVVSRGREINSIKVKGLHNPAQYLGDIGGSVSAWIAV